MCYINCNPTVILLKMIRNKLTSYLCCNKIFITNNPYFGHIVNKINKIKFTQYIFKKAFYIKINFNKRGIVMKVFNCILGVFSIIGAIYCIFYPGITFLNSGWIVSVLLGVWGICAIFDYVSNRKNNENSKSKVALGILGLICGIAAAVLSILAIFIPAIYLMLDMIILYLFSFWLIVSGISSIIASVQMKKVADSAIWILTLIWGILVLIAGIYGVFHMIFLAQMLGILMGVLLITYGVRLISSVFEN